MIEFIVIFSFLSGMGVIFSGNLFVLLTALFCVVTMWAFLSVNWEFYSLSYYFYSDTMSNSFVILSSFIGLIMVYSSYKIYTGAEFSKLFSGLIYILFLVLLLSFFSGYYLLFYVFFVVSLIPTLLIITGWGYQPERLQAGVYFLFYTL